MDLWDWLLGLLRGEIGAALVAFGLLSVRWLVLLSVAPFPALGEIGAGMRVALAAAFAVGSLPAALPASTDVLVPTVALGLVFKEALVGLTLGAIVAFVIAAFETAGQLADLFRGSTLAEVLVGPSEGRTSPLGGFFPLAAVALLVSSGGFLVLVGALVRSVELFPVDAMPTVLLRPEGLVGGILALFGRAWEVGFLLAAPALGVSLLIDVTLGLAARVSPGFEGYFLAMPVRAVLGVGAMVVSLVLLRPHLSQLLRAAIRLFS